MNDTSARTRVNSPIPNAAADPAKVTQVHSGPPKSRFEKFASTQAGGDGVEGEVLKSGKTQDEKIGASMPDRK
jgi:hypothetical protein